jgi:hypothetical protein
VLYSCDGKWILKQAKYIADLPCQLALKTRQMAFRKKFIVGDESLNTYGTWLLNSGADMSYFNEVFSCIL